MFWITSFRYPDSQVQCDERLPRCSRCNDLDKDCQYPKEEGQLKSRSSPGPRAQKNDSVPLEVQNHGLASVGPHISGTESRKLSSASSPTMVQASNLSPAFAGDGNQTSLNSRLSTHVLDARDLELLSHYLSHTSRSIAYDRDDLYALHVGIPNLAFGSKALMSSMLALAAACQCHDLLEATPAAPRTPEAGSGLDMPRIRELLVLAEQHHAASLRQIQEDIPSTERYDHVLANAALMFLYGSASHWVRIRLMRMCEAGSGGGSGGASQVPGEFVPVRSQWMSLIRAVHSAYVGLLADQAQNVGAVGISDCERSSPPVVDFSNVEIMYPQDGPSDETRRLFLPIVAATSDSALSRLRARARQVERDAGPNNASFQACMESLTVFESILSETFREKMHTGLSPETPGSQTDDKREPGYPHSLGRLSNVAPWLRTYTARVTMNSRDSRPLRRTVNAFTNRVPTAYLHMVQATLEHIPVHKSQAATPKTGDAGYGPVHRLAMDIFAHWLVLVLLLDGVWWIGGIGAWELGGVVAYMREGGSVGRGDEEESEAWWPESMYKIRVELSRHLAE